MPPITNKIIFWHTVKIYLWTKAIEFVKSKILKKITCWKKQAIVALLGGSFIYKFLTYLVDYILCKLMDMRRLNVFDEFFMYDDDRNLAHPTMSLSFTKFEFQPMSDYLRDEFSKIDPLRCKITNYFGSQFFQNLTPEEYAQCWPKMCIKIDDIHTQDDL